MYDNSPKGKRLREDSHEKKVLFSSCAKAGQGYHCVLHGENPTHDTDDCNAFKSLKRRKTNSKGYNFKKKKLYSAKKDSFKALNAFITAKVNTSLKKIKKDKNDELNTFEQFRVVTLSNSEDGKNSTHEESDNDKEGLNTFSESEEDSDKDSS